MSELEEGVDAQYARSPATFTGSAAQAAATLAARRADAIADKADDMRGTRRPAAPEIAFLQNNPAPRPGPRAEASATQPASVGSPSAEGLPNVEVVPPSEPLEPQPVQARGLPEPVHMQPAAMPAPIVPASSAVRAVATRRPGARKGAGMAGSSAGGGPSLCRVGRA